LLDIDACGEVLVGGFYGGEVFIGSDTPPLLESVSGVIDYLDEIDPGIVPIGRNGKRNGRARATASRSSPTAA